MVKKNLLLLIMAFLTLSIVSCKDDDDKYLITDTDVNGVYSGTLDVGAPWQGGQLGANGIKQKIYITKTGENLVKLELKNFVFNNIPVGTIEIKDIAVRKVGNDFLLEGSGKLTLIVGGCDANVVGTVYPDGNCRIVIDVEVTSKGNVGDFFGLNVNVDFNGKKLANDQSSEALIKSFSFNSDSVTNVAISASGIQYYLSEGTKNLTFTPTIEISAGASITPVSGVAQDFSKPVTYTVVSEDGITTVNYIVKKEGKIKYIDFEEWEVDGYYGFPKLKGGFASTNEGSGIVYMLLGGLKDYAGFENTVVPEWCVKSFNDGKSDKAAVLETVNLSGSKATLTNFIKAYPDKEEEGYGYVLTVCPDITAGSLFLGSFDLFAALDNPLKATQFGVPYIGKPVKFSGWYKYTPGSQFQDETGMIVSGKVDECAIYALLYEAKDESDKDVVLTGVDVNDSKYIILRAEVADKTAKTDWTYFDIPFVKQNNKEYDPRKEYKLALISTSSREGDHYRGAPGSKLVVDSFQITVE